MEKFNNFTANRRFTYESSENLISWAHDYRIRKKVGNYLAYKVYRSPSVLYAFSRPEHTKRSVVFSQTLRIIRLWSEENDIKNYRCQMKSLFLKRGYPEKRIDNEMRKVKFCKEGIKRLKELKAYHLLLQTTPN